MADEIFVAACVACDVLFTTKGPFRFCGNLSPLLLTSTSSAVLFMAQSLCRLCGLVSRWWMTRTLSPIARHHVPCARRELYRRLFGKPSGVYEEGCMPLTRLVLPFADAANFVAACAAPPPLCTTDIVSPLVRPVKCCFWQTVCAACAACFSLGGWRELCRRL